MGTSLRGRVGRHANTGAQCQNWVEDQQTVIALLNLIPVADGGTGASLTGRVVPGVSSDALFNAILRFQKQRFPTQQTGFIDTSGPVLGLMITLAARPTAAPKPAGQWGEFQSGSVQRALHAALADDHFLSQVKVVEILRSTLSNGTLSTSELADLQMVADSSRSIMPRSKTMLELFVKQARDNIKNIGPYKLPTSGHMYAANLACDFLRRRGNGLWPRQDRDEVGVGMLMRIAYPGLIRQGGASLCGPAAMLYNLVRDRPAAYARYAIDLYETGEAKMVDLSVKPSDTVRFYAPPSTTVDAVDWLTAASLRDSENWFFSYDMADKVFQGATTQMELAYWFHRAGYSDVKEDANLLRHQRDTKNMDEASRLISAGYRVCLLIDGQMLYTEEQAESGSKWLRDRHWVVLQSPIDRSGGNVKMTIYTWGDGNRQVPQSGVLPLDDFLLNFYGYVAAKP
jgi:hypothetical protein